jgi:hypothetical protein
MGALKVGNGCRTLVLAVLLGTWCGAGIQAQRGIQPRFPDDGFLSPVAIMGEVNRPGEYHLITNLTLAELLDAAGGLTRRANGVVVVVHFSNNPPLTPPSRAQLAPLMRAGAAVPPNMSLRRIPIADRASLSTAVRLDPQDVLYVPARNEV